MTSNQHNSESNPPIKEAKVPLHARLSKYSKHSEHDLAVEDRILNYILLFFTCAFIGWIWEVTLHFIQHGQIVNRGVLHGPWLPIYGFGGLGIALLLNRFKKYPAVIFLAGAFCCGLMEYLTGWYLETFKGLKWWDYGDALLSLNGRVCLLSVTCFGLCALLIIYYVYPLLTRVYSHVSLRPKKILCLVLIFCFVADFIYSSDRPNTGEGITDNLGFYTTTDENTQKTTLATTIKITANEISKMLPYPSINHLHSENFVLK